MKAQLKERKTLHGTCFEMKTSDLCEKTRPTACRAELRALQLVNEPNQKSIMLTGLSLLINLTVDAGCTKTSHQISKGYVFKVVDTEACG